MKENKMERRIIRTEQQDIKLNCTMLENPQSRGLCVVFPGKGYTTDRPLLYYSIRQAMARGYNLLIVNYGEFTMSETTRVVMKELIQGVIEDVLEQREERGDLVFIGKSIGALFASDTALSMGRTRPIRCVYLTPLDAMVANMARTDFIAFAGSRDKLLDHSKAEEDLGEAAWRLKVFSNADHSLNVSDPVVSIRILSEVIGKIGEFIQMKPLSIDSFRE